MMRRESDERAARRVRIGAWIGACAAVLIGILGAVESAAAFDVAECKRRCADVRFDNKRRGCLKNCDVNAAMCRRNPRIELCSFPNPPGR